MEITASSARTASLGSYPAGRWLSTLNARVGEAGDVRGQRGGVSLEHEKIDVSEDALDPLRRNARTLRSHDLLHRRRLRALVGVEQVFVELLARLCPDGRDRDVATRLVAREPNHRLGELEDPHRFSHLE